MIINLSSDLGRMDIYESGWVLRGYVNDIEDPDAYRKLVSIDQPGRLLELSKVPSETANLVSHIFKRNDIPLTVRFDDVDVTWHKYPNTWPVTLDSLVHMLGQARSEAFESSTRIADVFTGLGSAGKHAIIKGGARSVMFSDLGEGYVRSAEHNTRGLDARREFLVGDGLSSLPSDSYELIVASAVPATPIPSWYAGEHNHIIHGTRAAEELIERAPERLTNGGALIVSYSSAGALELEAAISRSGGRRTELARHELEYREDFLDAHWIDFLVERGGLRRDDDGCVHDAIVSEVRYS